MSGKVDNLVLYYSVDCHYCKKVTEFLRENNIDILMKNVTSEPKIVDELLRLTGRYTIPCLFIDGVPKYESTEIIKWLLEYVKSNAL